MSLPVADEPPATAVDPSIPGDAAQPPDLTDPESDTSTSGTSPLSEQQEATVEEHSVPDETAVGDESTGADETAVGDESTGADETAVGDESTGAEETAVGDVPMSVPVRDEPLAEVPVFPPLGDRDSVARWTVEIVEWLPHDTGAFTQGLEIADGTMYESTGLWGQSSMRTVHLATGEAIAHVALSDGYFGEGLTVVGEEIIQLTWQSGTAFVYDRHTLQTVAEHGYEGEGWGLCLSQDVLIMSDGSDRLARRDPETFELLGTVTVTAPGYHGRLDHLNELECVEDLVIANVWQTARLLVLDPATGRAVAVIDAEPLIENVLASSVANEIDVLNGVAFDPDTATLWMTGKLWPRLYRVRVVEVQ